MEITSAVDETSRSLPRGGGGLRSIGDAFQPNLAMGGGSYRVPFDLPLGPGGFSPKIDLIYNTGYGNGPFGLGWMFSTPFIERKRKSSFSPPGEVEYRSLEPKRSCPSGTAASLRSSSQAFRRSRSMALTGVRLPRTSSRCGSARRRRAASPEPSTASSGFTAGCWTESRSRGGGTSKSTTTPMDVSDICGRIRWSVFRLELEYEPRIDPFSQFDSGFELRTTRRCRRIALHQDRLAPETLMRPITAWIISPPTRSAHPCCGGSWCPAGDSTTASCAKRRCRR